jgi:NMD protein affecting ribosome stability and mRNA decay
MSDLQCPKCGKPSTGVCTECYIKDHPIQVKLQNYKECMECSQTYFKGRWYEDRDEMMRELARRSIYPPSGTRATVLDVKWEQLSNRVEVEAKVQGNYGGSFYKQAVKWDLRPERVKCQTCVKLGSGYYEAVLQVRDGLEIDLDSRQVGNFESTRGGTDYYMISMDYAQKRVSELIAKGYLVKQSTKLHGKKNGKDLFRFYYSLKKPPFMEGDFLEYEGQIMRVREVGKMVKLNILPNLRPTSTTVNRLEDAKVLAKSKDVRKAIITEVRPDGMQIMDAQDCTTYYVPAKEGKGQGQEVDVIKIRDTVFVL